MAERKKGIRRIGEALWNIASPAAWAKQYGDRLAKIREDYEAEVRRKQIEPLERRILKRSPQLRKSYLGGK